MAALLRGMGVLCPRSTAPSVLRGFSSSGVALAKVLHVGNLPPQATERKLQAFLTRKAGPCTVRFVIDRETLKPRGFAYVHFADDRVAQTVFNRLHNTDFMGKLLFVAWPDNPVAGLKAAGFS
eukprot:RCo002762